MDAVVVIGAAAAAAAAGIAHALGEERRGEGACADGGQDREPHDRPLGHRGDAIKVAPGGCETIRRSTDADGRFSFTGSPLHNIQVSADKAGAGRSARLSICLTFRSQNVTLTLSRTG
jgi:hypothetical protein